MDKNEYAGWMRLTKASEHKWVHDTVMFHNHGIHLFYKGGTDGIYIQIMPDGTASIGNYAMAIPHIGDAMFTVKHSKKLAEDADTALGIVLERMGLQFLLDFINPPEKDIWANGTSSHKRGIRGLQQRSKQC